MFLSILYVTDAKTKLSIDENRIIADYEDGTRHSLPIQSVEGITFFTRAHISVACMEECLRHGIPVAFLSKGGRYFGRLVSACHVDAALQRKQSALYDTEFATDLAQRIIAAKTKNQLTVLRRYAKSKNADVTGVRENMCRLIAKIPAAKSVEEIMGYEGQCAKNYFAGLSMCIEPTFAFNGRSRRPPRDPFNSLISLGYSVLMNDIYNEIETRGLNPYFGFMHRDAEKHPTLASDLLEEWRAVIVDSMAMSLINGHEMGEEHFCFYDEQPGCFLTRDGMKIFLKKLEGKMQTKAKYFEENAVTFRRAVALQTGRLATAILEGDAALYEPVTIR